MFALSSLLNGASSDPFLLGSQILIVMVAVLLLFFLFYALRDILQRSHSLIYQFCSIVLVAVFPVVGFFLYLLIRPARTVVQRQTDRRVEDLWNRFCAEQGGGSPHQAGNTHADAPLSPPAP